MNKQELIKKIAADAGLTQKQAAAALEATVKSIEDTVADGGKVSLIGFGAFETKVRPERVGRNPRTKEEVKIPASKAPVFKAGKALKDALN